MGLIVLRCGSFTWGSLSVDLFLFSCSMLCLFLQVPDRAGNLDVDWIVWVNGRDSVILSYLGNSLDYY